MKKRRHRSVREKGDLQQAVVVVRVDVPDAEIVEVGALLG